MLMPGYDVAKAAQAVAYFALKAGGRINILKLAKLLYLAEREFLARYDEPMFFDHLVSMPDGPVTSITLNMINGNVEDDLWKTYVSPRTDYDISPAKGVTVDALDELSAADTEVMDDLWQKFKDFDKYRLRDWTHQKKNIPEWEDPRGSSYPIHQEKLLAYLGKENAQEIIEQISIRRNLSEDLARSK